MSVKLQDTLIYARGLRADRAAAYLGMGKTKFLELVDNGRMPKAVVIDGIRVWDRIELDAAFEAAKISLLLPLPRTALVNSRAGRGGICNGL